MPQSSHSEFYAPQNSSTTPGRGEPRFLDKVANACRVKHLSYRTEQSYVAWVRRFILFHNKRHPQGGPGWLTQSTTWVNKKHRPATLRSSRAVIFDGRRRVGRG